MVLHLSLEAIASLTQGIIIQQGSSTSVLITGVAPLNAATTDEASFLGNEKYFADFLSTRAGVVIVPPDLPQYPEGVAIVEVANPSLAFNAIVKHFLAGSTPFTPGVHPTAVVDSTAQFNPKTVCIGPGAVIGANVCLGDGCDIGPHCVIYDSATLGTQCRLYAHVVIRERCRLGDHVVIQPNSTIGADGFGFLLNEQGKYVGIDQVGIVEIGSHVDIGANSTIDRARFGKTIIGEGTKIDNLVQIGHNCVIGKHCVIVSQSGIAGSTTLGDYVTVAAQVGIAGHLHIGDKAVLATRTGVNINLEPGGTYWGTPVCTFRDTTKQIIALRKLPAMMKEFNALKKNLHK